MSEIAPSPVEPTNKIKLRLTRSADQLKVFKLKKRKKCKHQEVICRIPLPVPPRITVWTILDEDHAIKIKNCPMPAKIEIIRHICKVLYKKKKERRMMRDLYQEVLRFCLRRNYTPIKIATLFGMYHATHQFFTSSLWHDYEETYKFFKETVFVHSINDPPESVQIFSIVDIKAVLQRFTTLYLPVLPLLRETILPSVRLWLYWHECRPDIPLSGKERDMSGWKVEPDIYKGRSDWDPWDMIPRKDLFDEPQDGNYVYNSQKLNFSTVRNHWNYLFCPEEKETDGCEEEIEEKETKLLSKHEEAGEEEDQYDYRDESQDAVD
ncbi:uncharacterized protein [Halyomorpha halys]|uniref:uncharacterized protein n=1 Tax=Halyomorpha halys TaxID=286706 RepID=UPI0006D4EDF4|nr:uncharacterized protein LOC106692530 [Halyomorpha halys]